VIPELRTRAEHGSEVPLLLWRLPRTYRSISSGPLGGGLGAAEWVLNCTVPMSYDRRDPDVHLREIAAGCGLTGPGLGLLTGVDVGQWVGAEDGEVHCWATVGLGAPAWAAAPDGDLRRLRGANPDAPVAAPDGARPPTEPGRGGGAAPHPATEPGRTEAPHPATVTSRPDADPHGAAASSRPGTVNLVIVVPARLSDAALVNAVGTATEAKAQALWELGLHATGTASDAVSVLCPTDGVAEPYGGPRSLWGARLAQTVHGAVLRGGREWLVSGLAWSDAASPRRRE